MDNWKTILGILLVIGLATVWFASVRSIKNSSDESLTTGAVTLQTSMLKGVDVIVYKSPNCGCCSGHIQHLKENGMEVKVVETSNLDSIKKKHNIPDDMLSCHTAVIGKYFVEGHVPIEAITKLIAEQPAIDGIALPGMPAGSAGMGGVKQKPFVVYGIKDGKATEFMRV